MTCYFFETDDGVELWGDKIGIELENDSVARGEVLGALRDMAKESHLDGDNRTYRSTVRNEKGEIVYTATMTVSGRSYC